MSYRTLLTLHGLAALAVATALAVYAVSGWMMVRHVELGSWRKTLHVVPVEPVGGEEEDAARVRAQALAAVERAGLERAAARRARFERGEWKVLVSRAAHSAEVRLQPGATEARVERRHPTATGGVKRLHRIRARGAHGPELLWAIGIDALAAALLLFSCTGVLLFVRLKRDRRLGWLLLGATSLYTVGGIVWLAVAD